MTTAVVKLAYQDETVAEAYDGERFVSPVGRLFDRIEKRAIDRTLDEVLAAWPEPTVLDIPCGTGRITELLARRGLRVTGGDISDQMIAVARRKLARFDNLSFRRLDLDGLDLPDNAFDVVTCIRLFHHLTTDERAAVLREAARVARHAVIVNVSYSSPYYRLRRGVKRALGQGVSRTSSTWRQIVDEAAQAGLRVRSTRFVLPGVSEDAVLVLETAAARD